jgi:tRNA C32,U32 (ribose-2'-O)-methylase TrmJ
MPRGVRSQINFDEQIQIIDHKLERYAKYVSDLKERRQALLARKQQQTMNDLQTYMERNNLEPDDVIARLQGVAASAEKTSIQA